MFLWNPSIVSEFISLRTYQSNLTHHAGEQRTISSASISAQDLSEIIYPVLFQHERKILSFRTVYRVSHIFIFSQCLILISNEVQEDWA